MMDPGNLSTGQDDVKNINAVLITHEHADHFHVASLKQVLANNPRAEVISHTRVAELLKEEGIACRVLEDGAMTEKGGVTIEAFGSDHACMHDSIPCIHNTGFMIANRFFYPGDAFTIPPKPVEILALPVAGPWMKLSEAIDYALTMKPKVCFPVHDGILKTPGSTHLIPPQVLEPAGISFVVLETEHPHNFSTETD